MLKATKRARKGDYAKMVAAASEVVMRNRSSRAGKGDSGNPEYVLIEFPYFVKFAPGFPKGHIVQRTASNCSKLPTNTYKVNVVKLLDWLYENGHSVYNASQLVQQTKSFEHFEDSIDKLFEI
jgi:hypothetical protein